MTPAQALNQGLEPHPGLFVQDVSAGSRAKRAGLRAKDVIVTLGDTPVANHLDFELGLFKLRKERAVPLTIQRVGARTLTLELQLR